MDDLVAANHESLPEEFFPDQIEIATMKLPVGYHFAPGEDIDGMTITVDAEPLEDGLILGPYADLTRIIDSEAVDEIILTVDYLQHPELEEALLHIQDLGVIIRFAFDPFPTSAGRHIAVVRHVPFRRQSIPAPLRVPARPGSRLLGTRPR